MEMQIITGRAGAGKSRAVLEAIALQRLQRPQVLLVPEHATHEAELDLCRALGDTASRDSEVLSFQSLATRVLSQTGGLSDITLDNGGKLLMMRRALQEVSSFLTVFARPSQRPAFLRELVELADELYAYRIPPELLVQQVRDIPGAAGDKLRSTALLFAAYDARLHGGDFDVRSRVQKLCDALPDSSYLRGKDIYIDGFSYFNRVEEDILATALKQAHSLTVTLLGDNSDPQLFQNGIRQCHRLQRMAKECGVTCEVKNFVNNADTALAHLERHFYGTDAPWQGDAPPIALYQAHTAYSEVEYVSAQLRRLAQSGVRWRDMAVAARSMEIYGPLLEAVFRRDNIPAYISRRSDILEQPVLTLLLSAVDAVTGGFEYEDVFRCLKTGMTEVTAAECDLLENYAIRWEIRGKMWLRDTDWTADPDGYGREMTAYRREELAEINRLRRKVRGLFLPLSEGMTAGKTVRDKAEVLYRFAQNAGTPELLRRRQEELRGAGQVQAAEEYAQIWHIFCTVLDQFVELLGDTEVDGEEFARLLRLTLSQYAVATIPATLDQVKVSSLTRNDRHTVKHLFLLGANDHVLPTVETAAGILDEQERELLQQQGILLSDAVFDPLSNELQNIYAALVQATETLTVSWCVGDETGAKLLPSFVVERVRRLFPQVTVQREDGAYRCGLPAPALALAGQNPQGALWHYFAENGEGAALERMAAARAMGRGRLSPRAVRSLYGSSIAMSASRLDRVKSCHFGYFMEYGLRAKERTRADFQAPEIGTFLHYLLENILKSVEAQGERPARRELAEMVRRYTEEYAATVIDGYGEKSARFRYLFSRLRETALAIVENVLDELDNSDFRPVAFELGFGGKTGELPAITVTAGDTTLSVTGKVDRVDGWLKDGKLYLRVVDYKTGKKTFDLADVRYGLGIQMLLYLFALRRYGGAYFGAQVEPAGVLYLPARDIIKRADRAIPPEKLAALLQNELRRTGMVLSDPQVLTAMEHSALESPCYLPIAVKKDGTVSGLAAGVLADTAQMGKMGRYVDSLLRRVAQELGSGNIDADPCRRGPLESACDKCPFLSACWFDEKRDKPHYLQKTTPEEFWALVDGEVEQHG